MIKKELKDLIRKARGEEVVDLLLKNARIVNVFSGEIIKGDLAIQADKIVGIGEYEAKKEIDLESKIIAPGFIDSHVHIESSMSSPSQFSKVILPRGVTSIIADPHEIANVKGLEGIRYIIEDSKNTPLDIYIMLPSCVPATNFENSGAILEAEDLKKLIDEESVLGLGEVMNYPGVLGLEDSILDKLLMKEDMIIDGHGPLIKGKDLSAYIIAGIKTEHECSSQEEVRERLGSGMYILLREGSAARDLLNLVGAVTQDNLRRFLLCTDDKHPEDLINEGSIDYNIKLLIRSGISPVNAIRMASLNAAECYRLKNKGAIAPGYKADLVVIDNFEDFNILKVFKDGKLVAENKRALFDTSTYLPPSLLDSVKIRDIKKEDLRMAMKTNRANLIRVIENSIVTEREIREIDIKDGYFEYGNDDILKLLVMERHFAKNNIGLGLISNFGLKNGAIGSSIAHDSHNLIVIGDNDQDILVAIDELKRIGGGLSLVSAGRVLNSLPLEIGGIMTAKPIEETNEKLKEMMDVSYRELKVNPRIDPFMTLAFMALPVIPKIKLTDMGLFDVEEFDFINIYEEEEKD